MKVDPGHKPVRKPKLSFLNNKFEPYHIRTDVKTLIFHCIFKWEIVRQ